MDKHTLVKYMMKAARKDFLNGKGRIFLPDFYKELPCEEKPDPIELLKAWREKYPDFEIKWVMENILLIELGVTVFHPEKEFKVVKNDVRL